MGMICYNLCPALAPEAMEVDVPGLEGVPPLKSLPSLLDWAKGMNASAKTEGCSPNQFPEMGLRYGFVVV